MESEPKVLGAIEFDEMIENRRQQLQEIDALKCTLTKHQLQVELEDDLDEDKHIETFIGLMKRGVRPEELSINLVIKPNKLPEQVQLLFRNDEKLEADQLPLIKLQLMLPLEYPSIAMPQYSTASDFYYQFSTKIQECIDNKYIDSYGMPMIFEWYEYCKDGLLGDMFDLSSKQLNCSLASVTLFIDEQIALKHFELEQEYTTCSICFEEHMGSHHFLILNPCMHAFCKSCMTDFCESKIIDGEVETLTCPSVETNKPCLSNFREKDLDYLDLPPDIKEKYLKFCVTKAIDKMEDIGWCPECHGPSQIDL